MDKKKLIQNWNLFQNLDLDLIDKLANISIIKHYKKQEIIFADGDPGIGLYTLVSGQVKVFKSSLDGKEQILHLIKPGEPFGEVAVFLGISYPAWAQTMEDCDCLFLPRAELKKLITINPDLAFNMLANLSRRMIGFTKMVESLSLKETPARLASYFLQHTQEKQSNNQIILNLSKGELASLLGTIPETLSRILNRMKNQNLIKEEKTIITILNRPQLKKLAEGTLRLS